MIQYIKRILKIVTIGGMIFGAITLAAIGLGIAEQPLFAEVYLPGNTVADRYDASVAVAWFHLAQQLSRETPGYVSPVASRAFGYMGLTLYEAIVPGMPGYQSLVGQINDLQSVETAKLGSRRHWPTVANAALAEITRRLFPTAKPESLKEITALEAQFDATFQTDIRGDVFDQSQAHGRLVARRIFEWSMEDGGHEAYLHNYSETYTPPAGAGLWQPTLPSHAAALLPNWRHNRPFVLTSSNQCAAAPPPRYSIDPTSEIYFEAMELYNSVKKLSAEQREMALFWADEAGVTATSPGHAIAITTQVLQEKNMSLSMAAITYSKVGMAMADSSISSWEAKYNYNRLRPVTYIQQVIDSTWNNPGVTDPVNTPSSPGYTSEHAAEMAAAMTVLDTIFGENYQLSDHTHVDRGLARRAFPSFMAIAEEAAVSQLYAGRSFRSDYEEGTKQGNCVGMKTNELLYVKE